jgi:haloacetate dehalogenase
MGAALVRFMRQLGWQRFALVGHDRGARVAYRMALDSPRRVSHLAVLDIVPTLEVAQAMSYRLAFEMVNWFLLAQPHPFPETLIGADPGFYVNRILDAWAAKGDAISDQARARYVRQFEAPAVRRAVCDEYRAAAGIDLEHDRADHAAGRRIEAPLLVLWSAHDIAGQHFDPIAVWRRWAVQVSGRALDCGHFLMEQAAEPVCEEIEAFLLRGSAPRGA